MSTWEGEFEGANGNTFNIEAEGVRPGTAPQFIWIAMEHDELPKGRALIALVGSTEALDLFVRQSRLPGAKYNEYAVVVLGTWPAFVMKDVVREFQGAASRKWITLHRRQCRAGTDRRDWVPSEALVRDLVAVFQDQVARFGPGAVP